MISRIMAKLYRWTEKQLMKKIIESDKQAGGNLNPPINNLAFGLPGSFKTKGKDDVWDK